MYKVELIGFGFRRGVGVEDGGEVGEVYRMFLFYFWVESMVMSFGEMGSLGGVDEEFDGDVLSLRDLSDVSAKILGGSWLCGLGKKLELGCSFGYFLEVMVVEGF